MEERNDALKCGAQVPLERYRFACDVLSPGMTVGDMGCGLGYGSKMLRDRGMDVIGLDNSEEAVEYARLNYPGTYIVCDLDKDDAGLLSFDAVVCLEALCHLNNPVEFLDRLTAGEVVISAPIDPNPNDGYIYRKHHLSEAQFRGMIEKKWRIVRELRQNVGSGEQYLVVHAKK